MSGQVAIRWIATKLNAYLNRIVGNTGRQHDFVVASDTDSVYLDLNPLVIKFFNNLSVEEKVNALDKICEERIQPVINAAFVELAERMNAFEQKMLMKREVIAERAIWTGAKRYVMSVWDNEGVRYKEPKFKMVGIEAVRSSTPAACRNLIEAGAKLILAEEQDELYKFITASKETINNESLANVTRNSSIKDIRKYSIGDSKIPPHVNGSLLYNDLIKTMKLQNNYPLIRDGDRIKFASLKTPNPYRSKWIAFPEGVLPKEFGIDKYIDRDELMNVGFLQPLETIAKAANLQLEYRPNLSAFFC